MNADAELLRGIYALTRGDLDGAVFRRLDIRSLVAQTDPIRINGISSFWCDTTGTVARSLHRAAEDFLCGLHGQQGTFMFLVESRPPATFFWMGASNGSGGRAGLQGSLLAAYPDVRLVESAHFNVESIDACAGAAVLFGVPTRKWNPASQTDEEQIETLCRGLADRRWLLAVCGKAVPAIETVKVANEVATKVRDVQSTYLLKNSAADQGNRLAKQFIELLELQHARLERGRRHGMWAVRTAFFAEDRSTLTRAKGLLAAAYAGSDSAPQPMRIVECERSAASEAPAELLNSGELAILTRLSKRECPGYAVFEHSQFGLDVSTPDAKQDGSIHIGSVIDHGREIGQPLTVARADLSKHAFVVGVTGSGKTNTCFTLLEQVWQKSNGVPFLVIEPAKSEYRQLLADPNFHGLRIFTVADETVSPIRLNPLYFPPGVLAQSHIDFVKALFGAAFVLYPPMPYVLEQSLQEIYIDRGWNLASNANSRGDVGDPLVYPTLSDLAQKVSDVVDRMGYDERLTMDIKAGLLARVSQLCRGGGKGRMLDTRRSIPLEVLFDHPCILELKQLVSDEEKAFLIGLILIHLYEYRELQAGESRRALKHVTLIEEAHRLLKNTSSDQGSEVYANPRGHAIEVFGNILSEIRAYGEGIVIAEQVPTKLAPDVVKNTNLKIIHRLVAEDDRKLVGSAINLNETQRRHLASLGVGDAAVYAESVRTALLVRAPKSKFKDDARITSAAVRKKMAPFLLEHQSEMLACRGCKRCSDIDHQRAECRAVSESEIGASCVRALGRVVNAIRLNRALVWDAYGELASVLAGHTSTRGRGRYCVIVGLVNKQVESRGFAAGWRLADVQEIIDSVCEAMWHLSQGYGVNERDSVEASIGKSLTKAYQLLDRLERIHEIPFAGCRSCSHQCKYRFDVTGAVLDSDIALFAEMFADPDREVIDVARVCWDVTQEMFMARDVRSRRGAATCFAAQQFARMTLSGAEQEHVTSEVAGIIAEIT